MAPGIIVFEEDFTKMLAFDFSKLFILPDTLELETAEFCAVQAKHYSVLLLGITYSSLSSAKLSQAPAQTQQGSLFLDSPHPKSTPPHPTRKVP